MEVQENSYSDAIAILINIYLYKKYKQNDKPGYVVE